MRHGKTDRADTAVEVKQSIAVGKLGEFCGGTVKHLRAVVVDLIEGEGGNIEGNAAERVTDGRLAPESDALAAENFVARLFIDVQNDACDLRIGLQKLFDQHVRFGKLFAVADEADHDLAADSAVTDEKMAERALVRFLVIGTDSAFIHPCFYGLCDIGVKIGLEIAIFTGDDAVAVRREKAEGGLSVLVLAAGDLCLVAIAVFGGRGNDGVTGDIQFADTAEMLVHPALFDGKLRVVADMAEQTAAAFRKYGAIDLASVGRGCEDLFHLRKAVRGKHLDHAGADDVADGGLRNEKHIAVVLGNAHAFVCEVGNGKGEYIVFL